MPTLRALNACPVGGGLPAMASVQTPVRRFRKSLAGKPPPAVGDRLQRERQRYMRFLTLCQALFELCGVVNQYVLSGKGFCRDQA